MKNVMNLISLKKKHLSRNTFCNWLDTVQADQDALSFTPSMSYFVLGFRDILELAKYNTPKSTLEHAINIHCEEDKEHWKWFLNDLDYLGYLNTSTKDFIYKIWSDEERVPRNMVYLITHLIQSESDPRFKLVIIECLEAAFAVFIEHLRPQMISRGIYDKLTYFGKNHDEGEQSHSLGSWVDKTSDLHNMDDLLMSIELNTDEESKANQLVEKIFMSFEILFTHWHNQANSNMLVKSKLSPKELSSLL